MAGYSGTPLIKKLGIKPGQRVLLRNAPTNYVRLIGKWPDGVTQLKRAGKNIDFVHIFAGSRRELDRYVTGLKALLAQDGAAWLSWPKKSSGIEPDIDESDIRKAGLDAGLVDVKICAVDETWSGLKFVIRVKDRR